MESTMTALACALIALILVDQIVMAHAFRKKDWGGRRPMERSALVMIGIIAVPTLAVYFSVGPTPMVIAWSLVLIGALWFLRDEYRRTHWPRRMHDIIPMAVAEFISALAEGPRKRGAS